MFSSDQKLLDACEEQNVDAYTDSVSTLSLNTMTDWVYVDDGISVRSFYYDVFTSQCSLYNSFCLTMYWFEPA